MARLHEHEGKALLKDAGLAVPRGFVASTADEAESAAAELGPCVVKIQAWTTGRKAIGGVAMADSPGEAREAAARMLGMSVGNFPVERVLIEERIEIARELFISLYIDDAARAPRILLSLSGGSGIEQREGGVHRLACDARTGVDDAELEQALAGADLDDGVRARIAEAVRTIFEAAKKHEARSLEVNPLAVTGDGAVLAADCRVTIDDYAAFRHPELGIEIARELDHPPTKLERIAYGVEQADHRGTFYFAQLNTEADAGSRGLVGFHGAGGGGSMMSMDAITAEGFTIANFTDTSGNPSAAKVYRAARIILSQPGLIGYFGSGSGVASQEQFWSAYGLAKAFWELRLSIPAVIRLGGNSEDRAVEILEDACSGLSGNVEGYKKDDPPREIAARFAELVEDSREAGAEPWSVREPRTPAFVGDAGAESFEIAGGRVRIDARAIDDALAERVTAMSMATLRAEGDRVVPAMDPEEFARRDSELIALEVELRRANKPVVFVELGIPGLDEI